MNITWYKIKEVKLEDKSKEKYDKILEIYKLLKMVKDYWYAKPVGNKTADLILEIDLKLFKILHNLENGIDLKIDFTRDELSKCFRKGNLTDYDDYKKKALEIYDTL